MKCAFPAVFGKESETITFRDFPEVARAVAPGESPEAAARDALSAIVLHRLRLSQSVPKPSLPEPDEVLVWTSVTLGRMLTAAWDGREDPATIAARRRDRDRLRRAVEKRQA